MAAELTIRVALADAFTSSWKRIQASTFKGVGSMGSAFGGLARSVFTLRNAIVGGLGVVAVKSLLTAFAEEEKAVALFNDALRRGGKFSEAYSARLQQVASSLQAVGTQGDDAILGAAKLLAMNTKIGQEAMPRAMKAAVDLAAALNLDLNTATRLVTNAAEGMTSTFTRYGIRIDESIAKSGDFGKIMGEIEKAVGGADAALAKTTAGSMKQIGNLWGDLKEKAGAFIAAILNSGLGEWIKTTLVVLNETLGAMVKDFTENKESAKAWSDTLVAGLKGIGFTVAATVDGVRLLITAFREVHLLALKAASLFAGQAEQQGMLGKVLESLNPALAIQGEAMRQLNKAGLSVHDTIEKQIAIMEKDMAAARNSGTAWEGWSNIIAEVEARIKTAAAAGTRAGTDLQRTMGALNTSAGEGATVLKSWHERLAALPELLRDWATSMGSVEGGLAGFVISAEKLVNPLQKIKEGIADAHAESLRLAGVDPFDAWLASLKDLPIEMEAMVEQLKRLRAQNKQTVDAMSNEWTRMWAGVESAAQITSKVAFEALSNMAAGVGDIVANAIDQIVSGQITTTKELGKALKEMFVDLARSILREMIALSIRMAIMASIKALLAAEGAVWEGGFTPIKTFASGGVVTQPTIGIVGEAGQNEAVVPLPNGTDIPVRFEGGGQGATAQVNITIHATDARSFNDQLAQQESRRLLEGIIMNAMRTRPAFRNAVQGDGL